MTGKRVAHRSVPFLVMLLFFAVGCGSSSSDPSPSLVGGTVSGLNGSVVLQNNSADDLMLTSDGAFTFDEPVADGAGYEITVALQPDGQTCTVNNGAGTVAGAEVTNISVTCSASAFAVGGTVSGLVNELVLQNNGADSLWLSSDGGFTFDELVADGAGYNITIAQQPEGQLCVFNDGTGIIAGGDVSGVLVDCIFSPRTKRVSVSSDGTQGTYSSSSSISADGRFVAFLSYAINLVTGDTNNRGDIFVHDLMTGETSIVSVASDGTQGDESSYAPSISADGRFVAFHSKSTTFVAEYINQYGDLFEDIFVHDRVTGVTSKVSVASDGTQGDMDCFSPSISADGRFVAFESRSTTFVAEDTGPAEDVFVHDRMTGVTSLVSRTIDGSPGNGYALEPSISADGRFVAFTSIEDNLVPGDTNEVDVFVRDLVTGVTSLVSVDSDGIQGNNSSAEPSISADGRFVAFRSRATNLVLGDTNATTDVFVHDRVTGETRVVSLDTDGTQGNNRSLEPSISADGRFVAFYSYASNLVGGDTNVALDVFVYDRETGTTSRVSVSRDSVQGDNESYSYGSSISADGRFVAFTSEATNLVPGDTNATKDVFVRMR